MTIQKKIYWLLEPGNLTAAHGKKINTLRSRHIEVSLLSSFQQLFEAYNTLRTSAVIIGDEFSEDELIDGIQDMSNHPDLDSTRFILSISKNNEIIVQKSWQHGFRGVLPLDLDDETWFQRFDFATSGSKTKFPHAASQMTLSHISAVRIPTRLVWIDKDFVQIESKVKLEEGARFKLMGGLANYLGVKWVTLSVRKHRMTNLRFRLSDGYMCSWQLPDSVSHKKSELLDKLEDQKVKAPYKAYLAISSYVMRQALLKHLESPHISINVALHKNSMIEEPKYLNPDITFIDESLTKGKNADSFRKMLDNIGTDALIYILGRDIQPEEYQSLENERNQKFHYLNHISPSFKDTIFRRLSHLNRQKEMTQTAFYIRKDHPLSFGEIILSSRLTKINPHSFEIAVPTKIPKFAVLGIESPLIKKALNRTVFGKVTESLEGPSEHNNFPFTIRGYLSDLLESERTDLGRRIAKVFADRIKKSLHISQGGSWLGEDEKGSYPIFEQPAPAVPLKSEAPSTTKMVKELQSLEFDEPDLAVLPRVKKKRKPTSFKETFLKYRRDLGILAVTVFILSILFGLVFFGRVPESEQGKVYSEQLLKFQQRFQNKR